MNIIIRKVLCVHGKAFSENCGGVPFGRERFPRGLDIIILYYYFGVVVVARFDVETTYFLII